ncbi:Uncharacterised protein [Pseudomonas putida]|nr:Uncharacterised protein [Pseudomonas putida]CAB5661302.1 Uncharacterised protein [Pseudomonas putida]CAB5674968.1 Uncharacterised protein [Pseudomonas putida]CAB5699818.1 Uncharacterised protein [Pseudomonas putida]
MTLAGLRQPYQHGQQGRQHPEAKPQRPSVIEVLGQRHRGACSHGGAQAQRHGVYAGQGASVLREIALDDARQQHANDADTGPGHQAAEEHPGGPQATAHDDAKRQGGEDAEDHPLAAKTPRQHRRQGSEQAQAQHWQGGQQTGLRGIQPQAFGHLAQHRRHARQCRAQVQCHQHQTEQQQPRPLYLYRLLLDLLVVSLGVDQQLIEVPLARWGVTGDGISHGLLGVRIR